MVASAGAHPDGSGAGASDLAITRTALAAERTLMAWIRTALSMISFGFAISKFLHGLEEASAIQLRRPRAPHSVGLFLAALGTASVAAGILQYVHVARRLGSAPMRSGPAFYVACAVLFLGLAILIGMLTGLGPF